MSSFFHLLNQLTEFHEIWYELRYENFHFPLSVIKTWLAVKLRGSSDNSRSHFRILIIIDFREICNLCDVQLLVGRKITTWRSAKFFCSLRLMEMELHRSCHTHIGEILSSCGGIDKY